MKRKDQKMLLAVGMNIFCESYRTDYESHSSLLESQQKPPTRHTCQKYFTGQMHNLHSQMTNTDGESWKVTHIVSFGCFVQILEEDWPYGGICTD